MKSIALLLVFSLSPTIIGAEPTYTMVQNYHSVIGTFDDAGDFVANIDSGPRPYNLISGYNWSTRSHWTIYAWQYTTDSYVYEFRSGKLIKCRVHQLDKEVKIIPVVDSEIVEYQANEKQQYFVYNYKPYHIKMHQSLDDMALSGFGKAKNCQFEYDVSPPLGYTFRKWSDNRESKYFARATKDTLIFGTLDEDGLFFEERKLPVVMRKAFAVDDRQVNVYRNNNTSLIYNIPVQDKNTEIVYEYRAGSLVKGTLNKVDGRFVPELKSKVICFKDYKIESNIRIYNLPGLLLPKPNK